MVENQENFEGRTTFKRFLQECFVLKGFQYHMACDSNRQAQGLKF